jgi:hypothetical protein
MLITEEKNGRMARTFILSLLFVPGLRNQGWNKTKKMITSTTTTNMPIITRNMGMAFSKKGGYLFFAIWLL